MTDFLSQLHDQARQVIDAALAEAVSLPELARRVLPDIEPDQDPAQHRCAINSLALFARGHLQRRLYGNRLRLEHAHAAIAERSRELFLPPALRSPVTDGPAPTVAPSPPDPADAAQGGFDDPAWSNPGRTDSERAFFERKRREHFARQGQMVPVLWAKPVAAALPGIVREASQRQGRAVPPTRPPRGYRRKGDPRYARDADLKQQVDRNSVAKLLFIAEGIERRTKAKGKRNGVLGQSGIMILRALLKVAKHYNGMCFPSYDKIREITGLCLQTIADALSRLQLSGFLTVINRIVKVERQVVSPLTGQPMTILATEQTSNAYLFRLPGLAAAALGIKPAELERGSLRLEPQGNLGLPANSTEPRVNPTYISKEDRELALRTLQLQSGALRMAA